MDTSFYVINVLEPQYYTDCHIKGSINIPFERLEQYAKSLDKNTKIVVYCAHYQCPLSTKAWRLLDKLGFTNVYAYEGGIREWFQKGYPHAGICKESAWKEPSIPQKPEVGVKSISADELLNELKAHKLP